MFLYPGRGSDCLAVSVMVSPTLMSLSLALYFLVNDKNVSLIIENPEELIKMPNDKLTYFLFELRKHGCKVFVQAKLKRIENDFVELIINNKLIKEKFSTVCLILSLRLSIDMRQKQRALIVICWFMSLILSQTTSFFMTLL